MNVRCEGLKLLAAGHADSQNVLGADVRPPHLEAVGVELRIPRLQPWGVSILSRLWHWRIVA
jgi:hypothetical protein